MFDWMFTRLRDYILNTDVTVLDTVTEDYEPHQCKLMVLDDVLTDNEIKYAKEVFDQPSTKRYEIYAHPPETHKIHRVRADLYDNHDISIQLHKTIEPIKEKFDLPGLGIPNTSMWRDSAGFELFPHCDQKVLNVTMQIYLDNDCDERCGTTFLKPVFGVEHGEELLTTPYKKGSGYILLNTNKELHGMMTKVPEGNTRTSLYIVYDKFKVIN